MLKFNVQVEYKIPDRPYGSYLTTVSTVHAINRREACILAMSKVLRQPPGVETLAAQDMKSVIKFWTFKFGSKIKDPENGYVTPINL